jgi:hypothetical protein
MARADRQDSAANAADEQRLGVHVRHRSRLHKANEIHNQRFLERTRGPARQIGASPAPIVQFIPFQSLPACTVLPVVMDDRD